MSSTRAHRRAIVTLCLVALTLLVSACRQDMHDQPKLKTYREGADRVPVEGTVARGALKDDALIPTSTPSSGPTAAASAQPVPAAAGAKAVPVVAKGVDEFPFVITAELLARGQNRFNVYCAPCHSLLGDGNGMIVQRGFRRPPSYHEERLRNSPASHFFDVMTNGFGAMASYSDKLGPADRWNVTAYIRALQLSQRATLDSVPAAERAKLETTGAEGKSTPGGQHQK